MAKDTDNWHQEISKSLVDAVHSVVADYRNDKMEAAKAAKIKEEEKQASITKQVDSRGSGPYLDKKGKKEKAGDYKKGYHPEESGDAAAYKKFFEKALKKFGVSSPSELEGDKKKEFFNYVDKNWTGEKNEEKKIKLSGKKEKVDVNPNVKEESLENIAMGVNPFQRAVQNQKRNLNEAFQHTWGFGTPEEEEYKAQWMEKFHEYIAAADPHQYVDPLQLKVLYTTGVSARGAAERFLGYRTEGAESNFQSRRRRFDTGSGYHVDGPSSDQDDYA